jgi:ribonuclease E
MAQKMLIDATHAEETRVVVVDGNKVEEFDFESHSRRQLTGNIYLAKVTRVEPSLQAAFVEYGGNRHGFLAFSEIHPDYYQIPKEDREALLAEEAAFARASDDENGGRENGGRDAGGRDKASREKPKSRTRSRRRSAAAKDGAPAAEDAVVTGEVPAGMEVVTLPDDAASSGEIVETGEGGGDAGPGFEDAPPPSAASGEIDIDVPDEPEEGEAGDADDGETGDGEAGSGRGSASAGGENGRGDGYEQVGGDDVDEERARPRSRPMRRYKIQEVIKVRQILLVQVVKEERGNKGAALTTYLSLAGRYCVLMPNTARGGGISRKITQAADRKKLKDIASSFTVPEGAGLIIRTAGANRTKTEIKRDYEYLTRQWETIRELTLKSIAPCLIYEEGSLIKRVIRDLYSREIDEILVDGDRGYREAKDYMKMLMPSHAKNVKHYAEALPLYSRYQVEGYLTAMFNPVVQLKSGGYIVIDVTEALVAIDVNSGRATREASVEETALKTNLEAAEEAARQMRLRDLAGLIVIDFIDMDERRNNAAVEKRLKEKLKSDRARIQVGRISAFGLLEMSRQRLRPGMIEATTKACPHCHGTGRTRSDDSMALALLRELEEEGVRQRSKEVLIACPVEIANYLLNQKREHIALIESRFGLSVRVEGDPTLISPDYRVERFKTASRIVNVPEPILPVVTAPEVEEEEVETVEESSEARERAEPAEVSGEGEAADDRQGGKRRRRRRRRGGRGQDDAASEREGEDAVAGEAAPDDAALGEAASEPPAETRDAEPEGEGGRRRSRRRTRSRAPEAGDAQVEDAGAGEGVAAESAAPGEGDPEPARPEPVAAGPFGDVIDHRDDAADAGVVEVPEADAPQRPRRRERVRKPAEAVLAGFPGVAAAGSGAGGEDFSPAAEAGAPQAPDADAAALAEPEGAEPVGVEPLVAEPVGSEPVGAEPEGAEQVGAEAESDATPAVTSDEDRAAPYTAGLDAPDPGGPVPEPAAAVAEPADEVASAGHPGAGEARDEVAAERPADAAAQADEADRPRRRGWWSRALGGS